MHGDFILLGMFTVAIMATTLVVEIVLWWKGRKKIILAESPITESVKIIPQEKNDVDSSPILTTEEVAFLTKTPKGKKLWKKVWNHPTAGVRDLRRMRIEMEREDNSDENS